MRGSGSPRVHLEGEDFASRLAALAEPAQETHTDLALDELLQLTSERLGENSRQKCPVDTKASIIGLLRDAVGPEGSGSSGLVGGGRGAHHDDKGFSPAMDSKSGLPTIFEATLDGDNQRGMAGDEYSTQSGQTSMSKGSSKSGVSSKGSGASGLSRSRRSERSRMERSADVQVTGMASSTTKRLSVNFAGAGNSSTTSDFRIDRGSMTSSLTVGSNSQMFVGESADFKETAALGAGKAIKAPLHGTSSSTTSRSLGDNSEYTVDLDAKYGAIDRDPDVFQSLVGDPMFVQCCVDAGVNPFDLFPHVADEVSTRSASKSRHGHESMHSRASIDSLLKSQCRPTVLSIGPEMLANPASRKQVVCAILREYEEARRTEGIRQREEEKREAKSRVFVEHVAGYYAAVMANQRARSQGLLERVHRLRVNENESLFKRKQRLEEQKRHKEELIRAHEEAEQAKKQALVERGEAHTQFCESIQKRKDEMLEERKSFYRSQIDDRVASASARMSSAIASRCADLVRRREEEEEHRQRCKSEADGQSQSRRHQLLEAIERKQQHFEGSVAQLQEERKTHVVEKKASEVMHHWAILRRKAYVDVSRCNARLEKVQGGENMNKIVKAFLEALGREQSRFDKFQVRERHQLKEQERFLLKTLTPGPGQYLGMNAARMLKPVRAFKIRTTSGKPPPDPRSNNPGPGEYDVVSASSSVLQNSTGGGHFSTAKTRDCISEELSRRKDMPGPGEYNYPSRRRRGGRFSPARVPSELEKVMKRGKETPGPGDYLNPDRPTDLLKPFLEEFQKLSKQNLEELARGSTISGEQALPVLPQAVMQRGQVDTAQSQWTVLNTPVTADSSFGLDGARRQTH